MWNSPVCSCNKLDNLTMPYLIVRESLPRLANGNGKWLVASESSLCPKKVELKPKYCSMTCLKLEEKEEDSEPYPEGVCFEGFPQFENEGEINNRSFWLRQKLKKCQCSFISSFVCPFGPNLSRAVSSQSSSFWLKSSSNQSGISQQSVRALREHSKSD